MQWANHDCILAAWECHNDKVTDHSCVFWMLDTKNLAAAAMYFKRTKRRVFQKTAYLLKHMAKIALAQTLRNFLLTRSFV